MNHSQDLQDLRLEQRSQGSAGSGHGPAAVPLAASNAWAGAPSSAAGGPASHSWAAHPPAQSGHGSYSGPAQDDPWSTPWQSSASSSPAVQQPAAPGPNPGHQMVPWQGMLTHIAINQLGLLSQVRDDDEDSFPSNDDSDKMCYRKQDHSMVPTPGPVKVRFTSANYVGTRNKRVCQKCWSWMKKPNSGFQVILRGSSREVHV